MEVSFMQDKTYHQQQGINNTVLLRNVLAELPKYVTTYFRGIENTCAPTTRLEYARDIHSFFEFLCTTNPTFKNTELKDIPISVLDQLQAEDFEEYLEYMKYYIKDGREYTNNERALKRKLAALRGFYAYLFKNDKITVNPVFKGRYAQNTWKKYYPYGCS